MLYRAAVTLVITAAAALLAKASLVDTVVVAGEQMSPTLIKGDRLIISPTTFLPIVRRLFKPPYGRPVVYLSGGAALGCLRVAACSGDTIQIDSGRVVCSRNTSKINLFEQPVNQLVPESYAPRDFFNFYRVPAKGDLLVLDKMTLRDFFFAGAVIQQENPRCRVCIKPYVLLDDSISREYIITDFAFYTGHIDSVPDSLRNDWFFWHRVEEYLYQKHYDRKVELFFTLSLDNTTIEEYVVKQDYFFMLADNRAEGLDSRYFGPIRRSDCIGRVLMVLWSHGKGEDGKWRFRFNRMGKFVS